MSNPIDSSSVPRVSPTSGESNSLWIFFGEKEIQSEFTLPEEIQFPSCRKNYVLENTFNLDPVIGEENIFQKLKSNFAFPTF